MVLASAAVASSDGSASVDKDRGAARLIPTESPAEDPQILWWYDLQAPSFGSAAVGDIDDDGKPEIVFGTYFGDQNIYALNAEDGSLLWKYNTGGCNDASPAIADVDLDGHLEVVVPASSPCKVYCFNGSTGAVEWVRSTGSGNCIDSPPAVADLDNDDKPEVVFGTFYGNVFCLNGEDGSIRWQVNLGQASYIQSEPGICDLDQDGQLDVVVAQWKGDLRVYALRGNDGSTLWYSDAPGGDMYHGGSIADIDEDGKPEIAIGCYDHRVYLLNGEDGSLEWYYAAPQYVGAPTSVGDLNGDGHLEIAFVAYNRLGILSHTGGLLWSYTTGGNMFRGAAIDDLNGDGTLDLVFGSEDGILRVASGDDGSLVWSYNLRAHYGRTYSMDHAPVIADFDSDGKLDVFVVGGYGVYPPDDNHGRAYALSGGGGRGPGWPMFRHDLRHTGMYGRLPGTVVPDDFSVVRGILVSGTLSDLYDSDDSRLVVHAGPTLDPTEPPVWLTVEGTASTASPSEFSFTLEAKANTSGLRQRIELYNYVSQSFEEVDSRAATTTDSVVEVVVTGDLSRFIDPGTLAMKAQLTWKPTGPVVIWPFTVETDQTVWRVSR
jgi:outer membrane protein assembly factor BamB